MSLPLTTTTNEVEWRRVRTTRVRALLLAIRAITVLKAVGFGPRPLPGPSPVAPIAIKGRASD